MPSLSFARRLWAFPTVAVMACCALSVVSAPAAYAAVPATPVQVSPANGAVGVPRPAVLTWRAVDGATVYGVHVATSETFATVLFAKSVEGTAVEVPGLARNTTYYWRVLTYNSGGYSPWSPVRRFVTANLDPPVAPLLTAPGNGLTNQPLTARFVWRAVNGAAEYYLQIATSQTLNPATISRGSTTTVVEVPGLARGTRYYWRVLARNSGGTSPWSAVWSFTTTTSEVPRAPVLSTPANGAEGVALPPRLTWQAVAGAREYGLQVSTVETFATLAFTKGLTGTSTEVPGLVAGTRYFWRVLAKNAAGYSPWSPTWRFTTAAGERPAKPVLDSPAYGATGVPTAARLVWLPAARATGYHVQVSLTTDFSRIVWEGTTPGGATAAEPLGLVANTRYFWRVRGANAVGLGDWSLISYFTTAPAAAPSGS